MSKEVQASHADEVVICQKCGDKILESTVKLEEGEILTCPGCSAEMEVKQKNPLKLVEAPSMEEDWGE